MSYGLGICFTSPKQISVEDYTTQYLGDVKKNGTFTNLGLSTLIWLLASKIMICSLALVHRKKWGCALKIDGFYYRIFPTETCHKLGP